MTFTTRARPTPEMRRHATIRIAAAACALSTTLLCAQTHRTHHKKPAAAIEATPPPVPQPVTPPPPLTPAELPAQPAKITYSDGLLTVAAHNSSLNQILAAISRETGMKITGGVTDERVFGSYGPETAAQVLNSLLDGTSSNMMLVGSNGPAPAELVLTPRAGGVTPPSPAMAISSNQNEQPEEPPSTTPYKGSAVENTPASQPEAAPQPATQPAPTSDQQQQSPNGVRTPQDIFNQLMKLRQQQTQQHTNQ